MEDIPRIACYNQIVKISCLLVYFDYDLNPLSQAIFDNGRHMLRIGSCDDLFELFFKLKELADGLEEEIEYYYAQFDESYAETEIY